MLLYLIALYYYVECLKCFVKVTDRLCNNSAIGIISSVPRNVISLAPTRAIQINCNHKKLYCL